MVNVGVLLLILFLTLFVSSVIRRRGHGLVPKRGIGIAADLGALAEKPRVRVKEVTSTGPDRVNVVLTPEPDQVGGRAPGTSAELRLDVVLRDDDFGYGQLQAWMQSQTLLAIVIPPASQIVRLRSIDELQPLTLRRTGDHGGADLE